MFTQCQRNKTKKSFFLLQSIPDLDLQKTPQKNSESKQDNKQTPQTTVKQRQNNSLTPEDQQHILHSSVSPSKVQKQEQKSADSPSTSQHRKSPRKSTDLSPSESIQRKTDNDKQNYNLRKKTVNSYSDTTALNVDNIVLDNVETVDRQHNIDRQSTNKLGNHTEGMLQCLQ